MKVCIDTTPIGINTDDKGGVYHYILNLIIALQKLDDHNEYILFFNIFRKKHLKTFKEIANILNKKNNFKTFLSRIPQRLWRPLNVPVNLFTGNIDIFHGPNSDLLPVTKSKKIITVHDLRSIVIDETSFNEEWLNLLKHDDENLENKLEGYKRRIGFFNHRRKNMPASIMRADKIIAVSQFTKDNIMEIYNIPAEKISVVYHGISPRFSPVNDEDIIKKVLKKYGIYDKYILYVGKLDPLKNIERLLSAFSVLKSRETKFQEYKLVLAGPRTWFGRIIDLKIKQLHLENDVIITDFVSFEDLPVLYSAAEVFVFPSLFEGFGIPLIEAMACGCPVVASNVCSISEVVRNAAILFNPYSVSELVTAINSVLSDIELRKKLIEYGLQRSKDFSWEKTASDTLEIYKDCLT